MSVAGAPSGGDGQCSWERGRALGRPWGGSVGSPPLGTPAAQVLLLATIPDPSEGCAHFKAATDVP